MPQPPALAIKALIFDVIVRPDQRSKGLGDALLHSVMSHPELQSVKHLELYCRPELFDFYRRHGFTPGLGEALPMRADHSTQASP